MGMSQWGAHGLASRGASHHQILTHYYTGVDIAPIDDPGPIEVGLDWGRSEVVAVGEFEIVDGRGRTLVRNALGTWRFAWGGSGVVSIDPPQGFGLPLQVGIVRAPTRVEVGESVFLTVALSRPARVRTVTKAATAYEDPGVRIAAAGRRRIVWPAPLEEGIFQVRVEARAGPSRRRTSPVEIEVFSKPLEDEPVMEGSEATREEGSGGVPILPAVAVVAALAGLGLLLSMGARRRMGR